MALMSTVFCCECGIEFHITKDRDDRLRENHNRFFCPSGHGQSYTAKTRAEELAEKLERQQAETNRARQERDEAWREVEKEQAKVRRAKRRAANGVCLCCKRTFTNVAAHMRSKHPHFGKQEASA